MIQIYTGEGKGKTTAAAGLAVRASKTKRVLFAQVLKAGDSSEIEVLDGLKNVTVKSFGLGRRIFPDQPNTEEKENVRRALKYLKEAVEMFDLVILDEGITAVQLGIISEAEILDLISDFPKEKELVLTGHGASQKMIDAADLVTEMKKIKHYYDQKQKAREGIEY